MDGICQSNTCHQGNCPGCKDGQIWCDDPRCSPYCIGCQPPGYNSEIINALFAGLLILLLLGVFLSLFLYGPRFVVHHPGKYDPKDEIVEMGIMI